MLGRPPPHSVRVVGRHRIARAAANPQHVSDQRQTLKIESVTATTVAASSLLVADFSVIPYLKRA